MSTDADGLKHTFGKISQLYDEGRPDYPAEIYPQALAMLTASGPLRILEVGCGTGKGTELFARHGHHLLAIDISPDLIAIAKQRFGDVETVQFMVCAFEQLELAEASLDLIISAQAFHWIAPDVRLRKAYQLLSPGGGIAIFWNFFHLEASPLLRQIRDVCLAYVPAVTNWTDASEAQFDHMKATWMSEVNTSGLFQAAVLSILSRTLTYTSEQLVKLLTTYSWFQSQSEPIKTALQAELRTLLKDISGPLSVPTRTVLITALKKQ